MENANRKIVAVVSDLMFTAKIQDAAKRAGLDVTFVQSQPQALEQARALPAVIILDLNIAAVDVLDLIAKLKSDAETSAVKLLGFVSHVQADLIRAAQAAGCDQVVARSAFSQNLPALLQRYA